MDPTHVHLWARPFLHVEIGEIGKGTRIKAGHKTQEVVCTGAVKLCPKAPYIIDTRTMRSC